MVESTVSNMPTDRNSGEMRSAAAAPAAAIDLRSRRVVLMVAGIVALSLADLVITLSYLSANSMMEANPIAMWLIEYTQSAWTLSAFKAASVGVCIAVLLRFRRHIAGELAAWCAVVILAVMAMMWREYSDHFDETHFMILAQGSGISGGGHDFGLGLP